MPLGGGVGVHVAISTGFEASRSSNDRRDNNENNSSNASERTRISHRDVSNYHYDDDGDNDVEENDLRIDASEMSVSLATMILTHSLSEFRPLRMWNAMNLMSRCQL